MELKDDKDKLERVNILLQEVKIILENQDSELVLELSVKLYQSLKKIGKKLTSKLDGYIIYKINLKNRHKLFLTCI